jgi:RepB plasmid partitioning protein
LNETFRRKKIARALAINVRTLSRKVQLLDGICGDAISLLKDKMCPMAVFDVIRKMNPLRQVEAAELLINANNFSVSYASAILAGTPQAQLATAQTPKRLKGMTAEAIARREWSSHVCRKPYLRSKIRTDRIISTSPP